MILTRRHAIALLPAGLALPRVAMAENAARPAAHPQGVPASRRIAFAVFRNGSRIGDHTVEFSGDGETLDVRSHAHFSVGLGFIKLFVYDYAVQEQWRGGALQSLTAKTNDNGSPQSCSIARRDDTLRVTGSKSGSYDARPENIPATHWNKAELRAPMINMENGVLMRFTVTDRGQSPPPGGDAAAHHYALRGFATLDLWYDANDQWVGARALAKDRSGIEYRRV